MWLYVTFWIHFVESKSHTFTAHSWNSILSSNLVIFTLWIWIVPDNDVCNTAPLILPYSSPVAYVQCQHFHGTFTFINHAWLTFLWRLAGHASKAWILMAGCGRMWQDVAGWSGTTVPHNQPIATFKLTLALGTIAETVTQNKGSHADQGFRTSRCCQPLLEPWVINNLGKKKGILFFKDSKAFSPGGKHVPPGSFAVSYRNKTHINI